MSFRLAKSAFIGLFLKKFSPIKMIKQAKTLLKLAFLINFFTTLACLYCRESILAVICLPQTQK
jgi:hypothetical protein